MRSASPIWTSERRGSLAVFAALALTACSGEDRPPAPPPTDRIAAPVPAPPTARAGYESETPAGAEAPRPAETQAPTPAPAHRPAGPTTTREAAPAYRALGTEPFWSITISGNRLTVDRPDHPLRHFTVRESGKGETRRFLGDGISLAITPGPCSDGMSDALYADRVQVALADGILKGCGGQRWGGE